MKRTLKILMVSALLALRSCETAPAAGFRMYETFSITNTPTNGAPFIVNGVTRTWSSSVTNANTQIALTNTIGWLRTNLYAHLLANPISGPVTIQYGASSNDIVLIGATNQLMTGSAGAWGSVSVVTNIVYGASPVVVPFGLESTAFRQWLMSQVAMELTNATSAIPASATALGQVLPRTNPVVRASLTVSGPIYADNVSGGTNGSVTLYRTWNMVGDGSSFRIMNDDVGTTFFTLRTGGDAVMNAPLVLSNSLTAYGAVTGTVMVASSSQATSMSGGTGVFSGALKATNAQFAGPVFVDAKTGGTNGSVTLYRTWTVVGDASSFRIINDDTGTTFFTLTTGGDAVVNSPLVVSNSITAQGAYTGVLVVASSLIAGNAEITAKQLAATNVNIYGPWTNWGAQVLRYSTVSTLVAGANYVTRPTNNLLMLNPVPSGATLDAIAGQVAAGDWTWVVNAGANDLTVKNESNATSAGDTNRISLVSAVTNVTVHPGGYGLFIHNGTRWVCVYPEAFTGVATNAIANTNGFGTNTTLVGPILLSTNSLTNTVGQVWTATDTTGHGSWQTASGGAPTNDAVFTGTTYVEQLQATSIVNTAFFSAPQMLAVDTYGEMIGAGFDIGDVALTATVGPEIANLQAATNAHYQTLTTNGTNITARVARFGGTADSLSSTNQTNYGAVFYGQGTSGTILSNNSGVLSIQTTGSVASKIYQTASGVGIGTNSPQALVHVVGTNGMGTDLFRASSSNANWSVRIGPNGSMGLGGAAPDANFPLGVSGPAFITSALYVAGINFTGSDPALLNGNSKSLVLMGTTFAVNTNGVNAPTMFFIRGGTNEFTLRTTDQGGNVTFSVNTNGALQLSGARLSTNTPAAGYAGLQAATNSGVVELFAVDSGGNVTQLSAHPLDAPPVFYITTNWVSGAPNITRTVKLFAGTIEWENVTLTHLVQRWTMDRDLGTTNAFTNLTAAAKLAIRAAMHREEPFATYNARMGYTNGDARALVRLNWAAVQAQRQLDYDRARSNELAQVAAGATNVFPRPAMDVTEAKPALVDWQAP